jgi:hypothetical protein
MLVLELARSEYVLRRENVIALGNSGTGKTHVALALGPGGLPEGLSVGFTTAAPRWSISSWRRATRSACSSCSATLRR